MNKYAITIISIFVVVGRLFASPEDEVLHGSVKELKDLRAEKAIFADSSRKKPLVLKSLKDGAKYFDKETLATISKTVDFEKHVVLVFAWKGSGQDRMGFQVAESSPAQVGFTYQPGRTRDLRPHVKVFVVDKDAKWSVK